METGTGSRGRPKPKEAIRMPRRRRVSGSGLSFLKFCLRAACEQELEDALLHPHTSSLFTDIMWSLTFEKRRDTSMKKLKEQKSVAAQRAARTHIPAAPPCVAALSTSFAH
jgi:hypothetical protein